MNDHVTRMIVRHRRRGTSSKKRIETKVIRRVRSQENQQRVTNRPAIAFLPATRPSTTKSTSPPRCTSSLTLRPVGRAPVGSILQPTRLIYCFITIIHLFAAVAAAAARSNGSQSARCSSVYLSLWPVSFFSRSLSCPASREQEIRLVPAARIGSTL